jgi:hypothetical protein
MSDSIKVVQDYILKSPENFRLASAISKEMAGIVFNQRKKIWEAVAQKCQNEFSGYQVIPKLINKMWSDIKIYKPEWKTAGISIYLIAQSGTTALQKWCYGIYKKDENTPYQGKLQDLDPHAVKLYLEIQRAAFNNQAESNQHWLGWEDYPGESKELSENFLAQSCTKEGFEAMVESYFMPLKLLKESVEPIIKQELQNRK